MASPLSNQGEDAENRVSGPVSPSEPTMALANVSNSLEQLNKAFASLNSPTEDLMSCLSRFKSTAVEIEACNRNIEQHNQNMGELLKEMKSGFHDDIKREVEESVRQFKLRDWIREEAERQVKEQVDEQIKEHLPQTLQQQADESKRQLENMKVSLRNSEARIQNSFIQTNNIMDPLAPILSSNGEKSPLYPTNAWSLFSYDLESAKRLSKHYELTESDNLQMNFKQFLKHIGTNIDVVVSDEA